MKDKKISWLFIAVIVVLLGIIIFLMMNRHSYVISVPDEEDIVSITLETRETGLLISDDSTIKDIFSILHNLAKSHEESKSNFPLENIKVEFNYENSVASIIYVYEKNGKYYLEQPYNGIYKINKEDYDKINSYINI